MAKCTHQHVADVVVKNTSPQTIELLYEVDGMCNRTVHFIFSKSQFEIFY